jgi:hypothetical protein
MPTRINFQEEDQKLKDYRRNTGLGQNLSGSSPLIRKKSFTKAEEKILSVPDTFLATVTTTRF